MKTGGIFYVNFADYKNEKMKLGFLLNKEICK